MNPITRKLAGRAGRTAFVPLLAALILTILAGTVWAAWGTSFRARFGGLASLTAATATPTRTPRPETVTATPASIELVIVPSTATPAATALPTSAPAVKPEPMPEWLAGVIERYGMDPARRFVVVNLDAQTMTVWEPGEPMRTLPVSTGDESRGYRTLPWYGLVGDFWGTFNSYGVYADEGWYLFEDAGTILIHGAPYKLVNGEKIYKEIDALGAYPASMGCIRLSPEDAAWFSAWQPKGVPIVILPKGALGAG